MSKGIIEGNPRTERIQLDTRTSDPTNPVKGEVWLRTDKTGTDKVGEFRWYDGGSTNSVDIVTPGTTGGSVEEVLRVQTPNGKGVIKTAPRSSSVYPQMSFQHNGSHLGFGYTIYGVLTDYWRFDEGSGNDSYSEKNNAAMDHHGAGWESNSSSVGGTHVDYGGDYSGTTSQVSANSQEYSAMAWINVNTSATNGGDGILGCVDEVNNHGWKAFGRENGTIEHKHTSGNVNTTTMTFSVSGQWYFVAFTSNGDSVTGHLYDSNGLVTRKTGSGGRTASDGTFYVGGIGNGSYHAADAPAYAEVEMTNSQIEQYWKKTQR